MSLFSERLNVAIKISGLSYGELSKKTGLPKATIQRYATQSTKKIPVDAIAPLENALNLSPGTLMGWEEPKKEKESAILIAAEPENPRKGYLVGYPDPPMTEEEHEHLRKYHVIPTDGKKRVDNVLDFEYKTFQDSSPNKKK